MKEGLGEDDIGTNDIYNAVYWFIDIEQFLVQRGYDIEIMKDMSFALGSNIYHVVAIFQSAGNDFVFMVDGETYMVIGAVVSGSYGIFEGVDFEFGLADGAMVRNHENVIRVLIKLFR